jgi:hypothetical protein
VPEISGAQSPAAPHISAIGELIQSGRTDGLPVLPPSDRGIADLIAASGRRADDELGTFSLTKSVATIRNLAENAFMAGCLPEYMPALVTAFEMVITSANRYAGTDGLTPWVIFNGPIRAKLKLNSATNVFGPSIRANAALGRAIRLGLINIGSLRPGDLDQSTMSQMYKFTCGVIGENEEESPWAPISTEFGFQRGDSTVLVLVAAHARQASNHEAPTAEAELITIGDDMASIFNFDVTFGQIGSMRAVVGLGSEARTHMREQGWSRRQAQEFLTHRLTRKASDIRGMGYDGGRLPPNQSDDDRVPLVSDPADLLIMATGMGGAHSMVCRILEAPTIRRVDDV